MGTSWTPETNTKAASTGSTQDTTFQLDSGQNFIVKNSSAATIFSIAESTGIITLDESEIFSNSTDDQVKFQSNDAKMDFRLATGTSDVDASLGFYEGATCKWCIGNDAIGGASIDLFTIGTNGTLGSDAKLTLDTDGDMVIAGDLTITGGDLTLGSVNYLSDATTEATIEAAMDTLANVSSIGGNVTIGGDLTVTGGDIDVTGEASWIKIKDNDSSALVIGQTAGGLITFDTTNQQERITIGGGLILEHDSGTTIGASAPIIQTQGNIIVSSSRDDGYSNGIGLKPVYVNTSGTNTIARHNYLTINTVDKAATGGSLAITDVCLLELEDNLGTALSCTTNADKTGNAN